MESSIDGLLARMDALLAPMVTSNDERRHFLAVYSRTTAAVRDELADPSLGGFVDPAWTERWDLAFAELYRERWNDGTKTGPLPVRGKWLSRSRGRSRGSLRSATSC
jgi:hypothetical protein